MESWRSKLARWRFNYFPAYWGTGAKLTHIAHDWSEVRVRIPLNWRTHNYVGTIFGGSLYGAIDPIYMLMLIKILGSEYIVWDKSAAIQFKRPGRTTLYATFRITPEEVDLIKKELSERSSINRAYFIDIVDKKGRIYTSCEKIIYIRKKNGANFESRS